MFARSSKATGPGIHVFNIGRGRDAVSQCPKQKYFPPVLVNMDMTSILLPLQNRSLESFTKFL